MPKILSNKQISYYVSNGFLGPIKILSRDEAMEARKEFETYEKVNGGWYELSKGQKLYLLQTWVANLVRHARILDAIEDILGQDIMCWGTSLFVKEPASDTFVSWHQDSTYWGLSNDNVITAWIALSPASIEAGCMKFIPGTHRQGQSPHQDTVNPKNLLTRGQAISIDINENEATFVPLMPGEISLHNIRTVHASGPNVTGERRIGLAIRYITPCVKQLGVEGDSAWLLRGSDKFRNFIHEAPPLKNMDAAALREHGRIMELRRAVLYKDVKKKPAHDKI